MRRDIYKICRDHQVSMASIHVDTPLSLALERTQLRPFSTRISNEVTFVYHYFAMLLNLGQVVRRIHENFEELRDDIISDRPSMRFSFESDT